MEQRGHFEEYGWGRRPSFQLSRRKCILLSHPLVQTICTTVVAYKVCSCSSCSRTVTCWTTQKNVAISTNSLSVWVVVVIEAWSEHVSAGRYFEGEYDRAKWAIRTLAWTFGTPPLPNKEYYPLGCFVCQLRSTAAMGKLCCDTYPKHVHIGVSRIHVRTLDCIINTVLSVCTILSVWEDKCDNL